MDGKYELVIPHIDTEHEKLFQIGEKAFQLLKNSYEVDKYDKIIAVIEELKEYTVYHFNSEENKMRFDN